MRELFLKANLVSPGSLTKCLCEAEMTETDPIPKSILKDLIENAETAKEINVPMCQDTGMAVVFIEIGHHVQLTGRFLRDAVDLGVRQAYVGGDLRLSVVRDPLRRINTGDNTPAILHVDFVSGDRIKIICAPKGFGSENSSAIRMFDPSASVETIENFVADTVVKAGGNPCPPVVVGVGLGGDFEYCAKLAKRALTRELGEPNPDEFYGDFERNCLAKINASGVGPQGLGGITTALAVHADAYPTHIAGLPVAVNICCHVYRHETAII
ncbi:fumarate hydratase [Clostridia bacterium]|nr:fumarate hydratase [Clostridia bacterium]